MLVAIVGTDGAGKSTVARGLFARLQAGGIPSTLLDKWDIFDRLEHPEAQFLGVPRAEMPRYISAMPTPARAMFIFWTIALSLSRHQLSATDRVFVADGYWAKHAAVERLYGCSPEWIARTVALFPKPDLTLWLDIDPSLALERKHELVPYECGPGSDAGASGFLTHQARLRAELGADAQRESWQRISALAAPEHVLDGALRHVVAMWQRRGAGENARRDG